MKSTPEKERMKFPPIALTVILLILPMECALAQDFKLDSLLLERKTVYQDDSAQLFIVKKTFVHDRKTSNDVYYANKSSEYTIHSVYWLFWNNQKDSLQILQNGNNELVNFHVKRHPIRATIPAVVLEFSELTYSSGIEKHSNRIFQIIDLETGSFLFYSREPGNSVVFNGGAHGNYRHDLDSYDCEFVLELDDNDDLRLIQTKNEVYRGGSLKTEFRKKQPDRRYTLTEVDGQLRYVIRYE